MQRAVLPGGGRCWGASRSWRLTPERSASSCCCAPHGRTPAARSPCRCLHTVPAHGLAGWRCYVPNGLADSCSLPIQLQNTGTTNKLDAHGSSCMRMALLVLKAAPLTSRALFIVCHLTLQHAVREG